MRTVPALLGIGPPTAERTGLAVRIVLYMILASAVLSIIATGLQLFLSYERGRAEVFASISTVDNGFRDGFQNALGELNFGQVNALLDGVSAQTNVGFVSLRSTTGQEWKRGTSHDPTMETREIALFSDHDQDERVEVGTLTIGMTMQNLRDRIWADLYTLIFSNFVKTVLASLVMLGLINALLTRHLRSIAHYVSEDGWVTRTDTLRLSRPVAFPPDELDNIVSAINSARAQSMDAYVTIQNEINERKHAEVRLAEKASDLEDAFEDLLRIHKEQAEFTYAVSHDLKSPTNTIQMLLSELRLASADELGGESRELLELAQQTSARMGKIIEDVLSYSQTIEQDIDPERVDLNLLTAEILADLRADILRSPASITIDELPIVCGSRTQLRMLLQNLISNALKFKDPDRDLKISITADVPATDATDVCICVEDNGVGIPPEYHEKIFGLFNRLHRHAEIPGTGLGLALAQRIAANHNGSIGLRSAAGQGARFSFNMSGGLI